MRATPNDGGPAGSHTPVRLLVRTGYVRVPSCQQEQQREAVAQEVKLKIEYLESSQIDSLSAREWMRKATEAFRPSAGSKAFPPSGHSEESDQHPMFISYGCTRIQLGNVRPLHAAASLRQLVVCAAGASSLWPHLPGGAFLTEHERIQCARRRFDRQLPSAWLVPHNDLGPVARGTGL